MNIILLANVQHVVPNLKNFIKEFLEDRKEFVMSGTRTQKKK